MSYTEQHVIELKKELRKKSKNQLIALIVKMTTEALDKKEQV